MRQRSSGAPRRSTSVNSSAGVSPSITSTLERPRSASNSMTRHPICCMARDRLMARLLFPTPPLPEVTVTTRPRRAGCLAWNWRTRLRSCSAWSLIGVLQELGGNAIGIRRLEVVGHVLARREVSQGAARMKDRIQNHARRRRLVHLGQDQMAIAQRLEPLGCPYHVGEPDGRAQNQVDLRLG